MVRCKPPGRQAARPPTCSEMPVEAASLMMAASLRLLMKASFSCTAARRHEAQ